MLTIPRIVSAADGAIRTPQMSAEALGRMVLAAAGVETREPKRDVVRVHPVLLKALTKAGFERTEGAGDTLSAHQMATLMTSCASVHERIELKMLIDAAGISPSSK